MTVAQDNALKPLRGDLRRLRKQLRVLHERTEYEDLGHGVLKALEIAAGSFEEVAEHYE